MRFLSVPLILFAALMSARAASADPAPFDLAGPTLRVTVTHQGVTLPIAKVPQLGPGDTIAVRADLPPDQSARYLLVAAFLRGSTNPPPDKWFHKSETWKKKARDGLTLTVPADAQQVVLFLAPETGGDFPTLRNAVQGRPGAFVRAAQDLAQASLDRSRLDAYLAAIRKAAPGDPDRLARITPLLARSLQVRINHDCLARMPSLQAACLLQNQESLVLNDGHSNAITDAVAGPGADLALQLSATPQGGLGYYSPYIAAIRDIIGIFSSIHTAKYQYIPALATLEGDAMKLVLNAPPSFHNPKSVLVTALPIVAPVHIPPLQIPGEAPSLCMQAPRPVVPMTGAPLIYSTQYAHDLSLRVRLPDGRTADLPATPDAEAGGLVIDAGAALPSGVDGPLDATVHGMWGFQPFDGPTVRLQSAGAGRWRLEPGEEPSAGGTVLLRGGAASCVTAVTARFGSAAPVAAHWRKSGPDAIAVTLPEGDAKGGALTLQLSAPSAAEPEKLVLAAPRASARLDVSLIARNVRQTDAATPIAIHLGSDTEIPGGATLTLSLRADKGARFTGQEAVEVVAASGGAPARLTPSSGLTIVDDRIVVATIRPARLLGPSAFGAIKVRVVRDGAASDWLPAGTLVRLPALRALQCPADPAAATCTLTGDGLFLIDALATTAGFDHAIAVPAGFPGQTIDVPRPIDGNLYLRLHDAPDVINRLAAEPASGPASVSSAPPPNLPGAAQKVDPN